MKQLKNLLFTMLLALLAWNCQKEESNNYPEPIQEEEDNVRLRALTIDELPDFSSSIAQQTSKVGWASKNDGSDVVLDGSRVLAVTDSVGNTTYSLRMYVADTPHNVFYNVVAKQTHEGVQNEPFVLRYEVDEDYWPEYVAGPREEKPFKGTIGVYTLEAFGLQMDQNGKMGGIPEPCLSVNAEGGNGDSGNSGGGSNSGNEGSSGSGGGGNHDPGNYYDYWNSYAPDYGGGAGDDTEPFVEVGQGKFGKFGDNGILKASPTGKSADCPEEETLIPINEEDEDKIIDDLTGKAKCLNSHLTLGGYLEDLLANFEGESEFDIKIKSVNTVYSNQRGLYVNGQTRYTIGQDIIYIDISTDKLSTMPALAAARTLIHEYIHADIYRKLNTKYPTNGELDFKKTYEKYEVEKHHNTMAELYVNSMKNALKDFHKNVLDGDYNYLTNNGINPLPDSFYEALAWQGLKQHNVKAYTDLSDSRKTELTNSLNTYYHSTTKNCPN
ncbi:hypothetical protein AB9K32_14685 [Allomuricauda sp. XS_ASV26]|uniref:hypothetical protein n=1 Tax=Allomuricauda sp. XS_ASV26 TaxID=3241292 RepID=UPI0035171694